jgi:hypothetical protein
MPVESPGQISVRGRFGSLQVGFDAQDASIVVPAVVTKMEVHLYTPDQNILYSLTGAPNTWVILPPAPRFHATSSYVIGVTAGGTVYFRKAYNPRGDKSIHDGVVAGLFPDARMATADDKIAKLLVLFN